MQPRLSIRQKAWWIAIGSLWVIAIVGGMAWLARYDNRPGVAAHPTGEWPADSRIARDTGQLTLMMFAHPRCDCTKASVAELAEVMARAHQRPNAYLIFIKPGGMPNAWEKTELWQSAARIPGVTVLRDDDGVEARRFGVETSGQVLLYAANGRLLFSGGDTGARGHAGENAGRATILAWLDGRTPPSETTPVFGCSLFASVEELRAQEELNHGAHRD
jgi:hypothetical protein